MITDNIQKFQKKKTKNLKVVIFFVVSYQSPPTVLILYTIDQEDQLDFISMENTIFYLPFRKTEYKQILK